MAAEVCTRNQFGYCKFRETCKFLHMNVLCSDEKCDQLSCSFRHPKECSFFKNYRNCKFGEWCKYDHKRCDKIWTISQNFSYPQNTYIWPDN